MSYSIRAASGSRVDIPVSRDLAGYSIVFAYSSSSTLNPKTDYSVSGSQNNGNLSFNLPTLSVDVYYELRGTKDGATVTLNDGMIYLPKSPANNSSGTVSDGSVTTEKIADNAVTSGKIANLSINQDKIVDGVVTENKIASSAVTVTKVIDGAISSSKIQDNAISSIKLADNSVTSAKIANGSITNDHISTSSRLTQDALNGQYLRRWQPNTNYIANDIVVSPLGRLAQAKNTFTSGSSFDVNNWNILSGTNLIYWIEDIYSIVGTWTWTKPPGAVRVEVDLFGAGSGGGSGRRGAASTARTGGVGGASGARSIYNFRAIDLSSTVDINIPSGGIGGAAPTTDDTNGNPGSIPASNTSFGNYVKALSPTTAAPGGGNAATTAPGTTAGIYPGGVGGATATAGSVGNSGVTSTIASTSGGAGGGVTTANVNAIPGNGAASSVYSYPHVQRGDGVGATPDGYAATPVGPGLGAPGGYGGGNAVTGKGGNGIFGSGGGGGGGVLNGNVGGAGGNGGDGLAVVRTLCIR